MGASAPKAKQRSFVFDVFTVATTRVAVTVLSLLGGILVARLLGAEGKGLVTALMVGPTLVLAFSELGVVRATAYHIGRKTFPIERIVGALPLIGLGAALLGAGACLVYFKATWLPSYNWVLVSLTIAMIPLMILRSYATGVFLGVQQIANFNRATWLSPFLRLVFIVVLAGGLGWGAYGVMAAEWIAVCAISIYAAVLVRRVAPLRFQLDFELASQLVRLGASFAVSIFIMTLMHKVNIVLLQRLSPLSDLGVYSVGANLAEYIWQIPGAMAAVIFSRGANAKDPDAYTEKVLVLFRFTLLAGVFGGGAVALAGPILIPMLYGPEFARSAPVLWALLPGVMAFMTYKVLNYDLAARAKPRMAIYMAVPALLLNIALGLWLIPQFGVMGAAAASSITYVSASMLYLLLYCRELRLNPISVLTYRTQDFEFLRQRLPLHLLRKGSS